MSDSTQRLCPQCGAPLDTNVNVCKHCGKSVAGGSQQANSQPTEQQPVIQQNFYQSAQGPTVVKSRIAAGLLGIFLGGLGIHKFYTGKIGLGIVYLLFCWTYIPEIIGLIEGIMYLCSPSDEAFSAKYVKQA